MSIDRFPCFCICQFTEYPLGNRAWDNIESFPSKSLCQGDESPRWQSGRPQPTSLPKDQYLAIQEQKQLGRALRYVSEASAMQQSNEQNKPPRSKKKNPKQNNRITPQKLRNNIFVFNHVFASVGKKSTCFSFSMEPQSYIYYTMDSTGYG